MTDGEKKRLKLPQFPRRPWLFQPTLTGVTPRLPRSIVPNSPFVNLNNHWDELNSWYRAEEEKRAEALAARMNLSGNVNRVDGGSPSGVGPQQPRDHGNDSADVKESLNSIKPPSELDSKAEAVKEGI